MQQVGGALGLAVLVTVFGHAASRSATASGTAAQQAQQAFIVGADTAFAWAAAFLAATVLLVAVAVRGPRPRTGGRRDRSGRRGRAGRLTDAGETGNVPGNGVSYSLDPAGRCASWAYAPISDRSPDQRVWNTPSLSTRL